MISDILVEQAQAVLVVESPHYDELDTGIPLSGESGRVVGRILMNTDSPIGPLCHEGKAELSIVNTFCQPLKFDVEGEECRPALMKHLDSLEYENPRSYKIKIKRILQESQDKQLLDNYTKRLTKALEAAPSKKLVVCGLIAQSVFEWTFGVSDDKAKFTVPFCVPFESCSITVFYVWHPSPSSGKDGISSWELSLNSAAIGRLKKFIGPITAHQSI